MAYGKNANYLEVVNQAQNLRQEYLGKLEKIKNNPSEKQKYRNFYYPNGKTERQEIKESDIMICSKCKTPFAKGYMTYNKAFFCSKCADPGIMKEIIVADNEIETKYFSPAEIEKQKQQLYQEYQQKFQKNASSVVDLTNQILTNLANSGYTITEIK